MTLSRANLFLLLLATTPPALAQSTPVTWHDRAFADSLADAAQSQRPVLVYVWMDGSKHCADLWNGTLSKPPVSELLRAFVCHSAKATNTRGRELIQRYFVNTLPSLLVVQSDGQLDDVVLGVVSPTNLRSELQRILAGNRTISALRAAVAAAPKDLTKRFALAQKLRFVGDRAGFDVLIDAIRRDDPDGKTVPGAEVLLFDVRQRIVDAAAEPSAASWDLQPMYRCLASTRQSAVLFKGYSWLADIHERRGDRKQQRAAWRAAWPYVPSAQAGEWAGQVLLGYWNQREDALSSKDRQVAREMARRLLAEVDGDGEAVDKARALRLRSAACGLAVAGKLRQAREIMARAVALQPDDGELIALAEQLDK